MNAIPTVLSVVVPIFAVALVGFVWARAGVDYPQAFVSRLATNVATPALIFLTLTRTTLPPGAIGDVVLAAVLAHLGVGLAVALFGAVAGLARPTYWAPMIFGNTGNIGLPLALFAFGQTGLDMAVIVFAVSAVGSFSIGIWLVSGVGQGARVLREPLVLSSLAGAVALWQGWSLPAVAERSLDLLAQLAIPLMLITLGVAVSRLSVRALLRPLLLSVAKLAICAAVALGTAHLLGLTEIARAVVVLQMIAPVAVTGYLIALRAQQAGGAADPDAGLVVVSTLLSVITLPVFLILLDA